MFNSSILTSKPGVELHSLSGMTSNPETYIEALLQFNDEVHEIQMECDINEFRVAKELILKEHTDLVPVTEGIISGLMTAISKIIQAIKSFLAKIVNVFRRSDIKKKQARYANMKNAANSDNQNTSGTYKEEPKNTHKEEPKTNTKSGTTDSDKRTNSDFGTKEWFDGFNKKWDEFINGNRRNTGTDSQDTAKTHTRSKKFGVNRNETAEHIFYHIIDWETVDENTPYRAIQFIENLFNRTLSGESPEISQSDLNNAFKIMTKQTFKSGVSGGFENINTIDDFVNFINTKILYEEVKTCTHIEYRHWYTSHRPPNFDPEKGAKYCQIINDKLSSMEEKFSNQTGLTEDQVRACKTCLEYVAIINKAWTHLIARGHEMDNRHMTEGIKAMLMTFSEAGFIHGESFDGDTIFDNRDNRDFNPTEWLDLRLTTESYALKATIDEARRDIALEEARIFAENLNDYETLKKLNEMRILKESQLGNAIEGIFQRIQQFIDKFIADIADKHGPNSKFIARNSALINNKKFNFRDNKVTSTGDILNGIERVKAPLGVHYDPVAMKNDLTDKIKFFEAHIKNKLNGTCRLQWSDKLQIADWCKAYFGASLGEDIAQPVNYTNDELEAKKKAMVDYLTGTHAFFASIKKELADLKMEAKKGGIDTATDNTAKTNADQQQTADNGNSQQQGQEGSANNAQDNSQQSTSENTYYSVLYGKYFNEIQTTDPEKDKERAKAANDANNSEKVNKQNASAAVKVYIDVCKDVLLAKLTAARFIYSELMQLMKAHVKIHQTDEQRKAEADAAAKDNPKGNANKQQQTNQNQA